MTILQEIQKWSVAQPLWQQDAISRIYAKPELSADDYEDLYALLKTEHKIPDEKDRKAVPLDAGQVAVPPPAGKVIQIAAVKNLQNVNALAADQRLSLGTTGLTVIFGENGAGKSGYSRVFKHACRARDRSDGILPDAKKKVEDTGPAQATFELVVDGQSTEVAWKHGKETPEELSSIAIFDSHCARAYLDNTGDFAYVPYGLDILKKLVDVAAKLKEKATKEHGENLPDTTAFSELAKTKTAVGTLLSQLSEKTKADAIEKLATMSEVETKQLADLVAALNEADPKQKAQVLKNQATRFGELATRITMALTHVNEERLGNLVLAVNEAQRSKAAADTASAAFKDLLGLLPGTWGDAWKRLFKAAQTFALESHADKEFPNLGAESACPLCQNELGKAGHSRLHIFHEFVQQKVEQEAKTAQELVDTKIANLKKADLNLLIDKALKEELVAHNPKLGDLCTEMQTYLTERRNSMVAAASPEGDWANLVVKFESPVDALTTLKAELEAEATRFEATTDEEAKNKMILLRDELDARSKLGQLKAVVLAALAKYQHRFKLWNCVTAAGTTAPISKHATKLSETLATKDVVDRLNTELQSLNVHELAVAMKSSSPKGKTQYKLVLELETKREASDVLSEGEQRAIAIASFLAEANLNQGQCGMVFDDPVSSLDHARREYVARRIARESLVRQVIVFTHDLFFLNVLLDEAREVGPEPVCRSLRRSHAGYGITDETIPFEGASTKDRVGILRQMLVDATRHHKANQERVYKVMARDIYAHLRMSWERGVEEVLFNKAVLRFRKGIETSRLGQVSVTPEDITAITAGMGKCSNYTGHDGAMQAHLATPLPAEITQDIDALETWRKLVAERMNKKK
jgi:ABC-type cobalamin/Fe3+-siderophores transport system ATPase subunit